MLSSYPRHVLTNRSSRASDTPQTSKSSSPRSPATSCTQSLQGSDTRTSTYAKHGTELARPLRERGACRTHPAARPRPLPTIPRTPPARQPPNPGSSPNWRGPAASRWSRRRSSRSGGVSCARVARVVAVSDRKQREACWARGMAPVQGSRARTMHDVLVALGTAASVMPGGAGTPRPPGSRRDRAGIGLRVARLVSRRSHPRDPSPPTCQIVPHQASDRPCRRLPGNSSRCGGHQRLEMRPLLQMAGRPHRCGWCSAAGAVGATRWGRAVASDGDSPFCNENHYYSNENPYVARVPLTGSPGLVGMGRMG